MNGFLYAASIMLAVLAIVLGVSAYDVAPTRLAFSGLLVGLAALSLSTSMVVFCVVLLRHAPEADDA